MSADREPETDEGNISYPSPGAETMEAGPFYNTGGREGAAADHQEDRPPEYQDQRPQEYQEPHVPEQVQVQEHQEHVQQEMPAVSAPETPSQHVSRPTNLVELQLAAQLGQGLAGQSLAGQGLAGSPMTASDPNMNVEDPTLRNLIPHPHPHVEQEPPAPAAVPSYVPETPTTDAMVQHGMPVAIGPHLPPPPHPPPQHYNMDAIPPRKRSKVSRACDECRRKKIKCDAQTDTGERPCSSCARSSIRCLFSRVPQKRGPSKGYIKELADRINSIEHKLESEGALSQDDLDRLFAPERPRAQEDQSRKRPFSSISTGDFSSPTAARPAPWGAEHRPIQPSDGSADGFAQAYTPNTLAPVPSPLKDDEAPPKPPVAAMDIPMPDGEGVPDIDEGALHSYLTTVQPVFPILPGNTARVQALLAQVPSLLQSAFTNALPAVSGGTGDVKLASSLLNDWESSDAPPTRAANIVHAQTLLMLMIDADWRTSPTFPFLLSRGVALANTMKLWRFTPIESASEPDSEDQLCVRIWWSLILMDRWHAAGTGKPAQIPDSSVVAPPGLENMLGEVCFYLVRLSKFLNRASLVVSSLQPGSSTTEPIMAAILTDYLENYREDLPAHIEPASYPLVHLAYWHCKLLVALVMPGATPTEILWPTRELVNLLFANAHLRSPLANHFASLAGMALTKLNRLEGSSEEAAQLIRDIVDKPASGPVWDGVRDKLAEQIRPTSSVDAAASQGLQHLADLATAHEGIAPGADEIAFGPSLASGYLDIS